MLKRLVYSRVLGSAVNVRSNIRTMASETNPVDWYPWGQEAIQEAKRQNKMIFLSIGYSTCHWCHVMERESFECHETAAIMNERFINIKVDREERPDVDKVYMTFVQASTGGGGWPLSLWLSPDLFPVFGGTYFPPEGHYGRPGFRQVLTALASQWGEKGEEMRESGAAVIRVIDTRMGSGSLTPSTRMPGPEVFRKLHVKLSHSYDSEYGGYSRAPKFPQPSLLMAMFKLQAWPEESQDRRKRGLEMNLHTLDMMDRGGIHDHIMNGYSTDKMWHVPHFEKMLYDQAQLVMAYSAAFSITKEQKYKEVVDDILLYVTRDMTHSSGGFFAAEDADSYPMDNPSEKKEGAFCVWSWEEIQSLLNDKVENGEMTLADIVAHEYNLKPGGNVDPRGDPHGELKNQNVLTKIPSKPLPLSDLDQYNKALEAAKKILFSERLKRPRPGLDIKIVTCWNSLMISGLCRAAAVTQSEDYTAAALRAGHFVMETLWSGQRRRLLRCVYGAGKEITQLEAPIDGFVEDYCMTVGAMLDLYRLTLDDKWLTHAQELQEVQDELFLDKEKGGYFTSREGDEEIVLRLKDDQDGAEPCSNSVSAMNLVRLGRILNNPSLSEKGENIIKLYSERLDQMPHALPAMVEAYLHLHQAEPLVVITGAAAGHPVLRHLHTHHLPSHDIISVSPLTKSGHPALAQADSETRQGAYILRDGTLSEFVDNVEKFVELIDRSAKK